MITIISKIALPFEIRLKTSSMLSPSRIVISRATKYSLPSTVEKFTFQRAFMRPSVAGFHPKTARWKTAATAAIDKPSGDLGEIRGKQQIQDLYDDWAKNYEDAVLEWGYKAPRVAAQFLKQYGVTEDDKVLDVGCGTGMTGKAVRDIVGPKTQITGVDISQKSLDAAQKSGHYEATINSSLDRLPFPFEDDGFDALECIGVLTYVQEHKDVLTEFVRVVKPGGILVFSHRSDHYESFAIADLIQSSVDEGSIELVHQSDPMAYLPGNEEYKEIRVIYLVCRVK